MCYFKILITKCGLESDLLSDKEMKALGVCSEEGRDLQDEMYGVDVHRLATD